MLFLYHFCLNIILIITITKKYFGFNDIILYKLFLLQKCIKYTKYNSIIILINIVNIIITINITFRIKNLRI